LVWCDRSGADVTDDSECIALSQLLMEMDASSSDSHPDSQLQPSHQFQCHCITDEHQAVDICIEHFIISSDDERQLSNIAGDLSVFMPLIVFGIVLCCMLGKE